MLFMSPKHQLTDQVKLLQKVAIIRHKGTDLEVLLLRRSDDAKSRPGAWDLPGGNSEWPSESQVSAANLHLADLNREINEETGLIASDSAFMLKLPVHFSTYFDSQKQIYTVICGWLLNYAATDQAAIQISAEHQAFAWVSGVDLPNYDFGGDSGTFVLDIIQKALLAFAKN
jgi:8-oxo-dGTP pyrophosphatase MutT (NUDIX family)